MTVRKARSFKREEADQLVPLADLVLLLPMKRALGCPDPDVESRRSAGFPMTARKVNSYSRKLEGEDRQVFSPHLILLSQTMDFLIDISIHLFIWSTTIPVLPNVMVVLFCKAKFNIAVEEERKQFVYLMTHRYPSIHF